MSEEFKSAVECFNESTNVTAVKDMSLRDWFAGMALQALISIVNTPEVLQALAAKGKNAADILESTAGSAYEHADAMLAERNKP